MVGYVNLFENEDFMMRLLAGEFDSAIKKGKMKMEPVFYNKDEYNEADSIVETVETEKCTDIEKAMAVLDGSNKDMAEEDFTEETWAEANEKYYSMDDVDYKEEVSPEGETVIVMSADRLGSFMASRVNTIDSWNDDTNEEANDDYIYEDDEVNVSEECDVTILSFSKAFSCMSNKAEEAAPISELVLETESRLDTLLDIIMDNQEEFHDRYVRHYTEDESYKKCLNCRELMQTGIDADDLTDKALARALYMTIKHSSINTKICNKYSKLAGLDISKIYEQMRKQYIDELLTRDDLIKILAELDEYDIYGELIGLAA